MDLEKELKESLKSKGLAGLETQLKELVEELFKYFEKKLLEVGSIKIFNLATIPTAFLIPMLPNLKKWILDLIDKISDDV